MNIHFSAIQAVEIAVTTQPIPIQHYLRQPQRLVAALVDPTRVEQLGEDCFRLKMRPLSFMMLSIQPTVDIRVWSEADGTIHVESTACEIRGVEYIDRRFSLKLVGRLSPRSLRNTTMLCGQADLDVQVELPPALWFTPRPILEATGNGLLKSVLLTIKQRLTHHLLQDYRQWAAVQLEAQPEAARSNLGLSFPT
ncbi:DUF1997 domain-containing protein [Microcoleus sp. FACHB-1515]|uniref:DUF1997 domain-containing protein n=1 Tax=Cyanophyceae TaxID=3028117 RepID=UPI001686988A|nr:DUF1997 domain-containing protein [Microcoleus sp. FACHB-1515]MBD2092779.1 DUF1997 domain-containing protein [Microcoleus sp. FACHB-1515]